MPLLGVWQDLGSYAPAWGMVGTLLGLINMMKAMGDDPSGIGAGMSLATGLRGKRQVLALLSKIIIHIGVVVSLASVIVMLTKIDNPNMLGANVHVMLSSLIYSFILKIIVEVMIVKSQ